MFPTEREETLAMAWPPGADAPDASPVAGYSLRVGADRAAFESVQAGIGFDVTDAAWTGLSERLVDTAMVLAFGSDEPVAAAAAERRAGGWVELGWVAVSPAHRGRGLGLAVCARLTRRLLETGETALFGSTQDHRLAALRIYFALGFHPVHRDAKRDRWRAVCERIGAPYEPARWRWPT